MLASKVRSFTARPFQPARGPGSWAFGAIKAYRHSVSVKVSCNQQFTTGEKLLSRRKQIALVVGMAGLSLWPPKAVAEYQDVQVNPSIRAAETIRRDFVDKQYYVTGDLTTELFASDCVFIDPTVEVTGVEPYVKALRILFDPATSRADLISLQVTSPNTVVVRWRLEGSLKLGGLKIKPYTGTTVYTIADDGKVVRHEETWDISTMDAFVSTFFPGFGAPPAPPVVPVSPS